MLLRRTYILLGLGLSALVSCHREMPQPAVWADPVADGSAYASSYRPYAPAPGCATTPPPKGYKAVYLSHYGRHGSRYLLSEKPDSLAPVRRLESWQSQGLLTPRAQALLADVRRVEEEHDRMEGMLTEQGGAQHQGIARRMARRFPEIFRKGSVRAVCSPAQRCIQSAANFSLALASEAPHLAFTLRAGHRYYDIVSHRIQDGPQRSAMAALRDSMLRESLLPQMDTKEWFTAVPADYDGVSFWRGIYILCSVSRGLDGDYGDLAARVFTASQLQALWEAENSFHYGVFCDTVRFGTYRQKIVAEPVVRDILLRADEALAGSGCVADLHFGHDSGLLPLTVWLGLEGCSGTFPIREAAKKGWRDYERSPMAANLQLVFYTCPGKEPLVKILYNEAETHVDGLEAVNGVFYRWTELHKRWEGD